MSDELETVLRLVAEGHLSPEEAAPIIDALRVAKPKPQAGGDPGRRGGRHIRVRVTERGRAVVNLRVPVGFADMALRAVPGLGTGHGEQIRAAIESGTPGPILDIEDPEGDGVLISLE